MRRTEVVDAWCDRLAAPYRHPSSGAIAAIVTPRDVWYRSFGRLDAERPQPPDEHTVFEIGSITKVFTSILLATLVTRGDLQLDTPIAAICPEFDGAPTWITPRSLATHTSGLPRLPVPWWRVPLTSTENPYASFDRRDLVDWVGRYRPRHAPPSGRVRYSNLGVGLLGYVVAHVLGVDYETALRRQVLEPLVLSDTGIGLSGDQRQRLATPHTGRGKPTPPWDFDALAGAGALRSSPCDLARFCQHVMAAPGGSDPVSRAVAHTLEVQYSGRIGPAPSQCLGWVMLPSGPGIFHHDGGTLGSASTLYVSPKAGISAFVLANHGLDLRTSIRIARANLHGLMEEIVASMSGPLG